MKTIVVIFLLVLLSISACRQGTETVYESVETVVAALDRHELSDESRTLYQLVGAYDGAKFTVMPGGYRIEIYVYRVDFPDLVEFETADSIVVQDFNALFIFHTTDRDVVDRVLVDLRSG